MDKLTLSQEKFIVSTLIAKGMFNDVVAVNYIPDIVVDMVSVNVTGRLFTKDAGYHEYTTPSSWLDHLKLESRWVRKLLGAPKLTKTKIAVRVVLNPKSQKFKSRTVGIPTMEWEEVMSSPINYEWGELEFTPTFYIMHE